jgi:LysR family transcriptional regulator, nod-box dependent transcriptional activator
MLNLSQLDLNQLLALDALLTEKSVSGAGRRMYLTQSAMSHALKRLQETFEDKLLVPANGRRMLLTPLAEELIAPLRDVLMRIRSIAALKPHFDPAVSHKTITVCASDYACMVLLLPAIAQLARLAPNLRVQIIEHGFEWSLQLERGEIDMVIIPRSFAIPTYPSEDLFKEQYSCVAWSENPGIAGSVTLDQYLEMKHVAAQFNFVPAMQIDAHLREQTGKSREVAMIVPLFSLLPQAVVGTEYLATVQTRLANIYAGRLPIRVMPLPFSMPPIEEVMQYQAYQETDQGISWFRNLLKATSATI